MADEQAVVTEEKSVEVIPPQTNPFDDSNWVNNPAVVEESVQPTQATTPPVETKAEEETEIVDADLHLKSTLGFDSWEAAKTEIEDLRKLKESGTKEEIKFANEQSKKLFDAIKEGKDDLVYEILDTKRKLSSVEKLSPAEVLKLHIEQTNKHYKQEDVQDVYEEKYAYPEKPEQGVAEDDDEFAARESKWKDSKAKIDRRMERDAIVAKTELAKLNSELTLPDIKGADSQPTPEAIQKGLEKIEAVRSEYSKALESKFTEFNGYEVGFKDEAVSFPINYGVPEEQRTALKNELKDFDVDVFISDRWFNKDGSPNIKQTMEDIYLLRNRGEILQKIANDAGSKRLEHHLKTKSNIDLNQNGGGKTFEPSSPQVDANKMADFFLSQS